MWITFCNKWISLDLWLLNLLTIFMWTLWLATMIWVQNIAFHILLKETQSTGVKTGLQKQHVSRIGLISRSTALCKTKRIQSFSFPYPWFSLSLFLDFFFPLFLPSKNSKVYLLSRQCIFGITHAIPFGCIWGPGWHMCWDVHVGVSGCGFWYFCGGKKCVYNICICSSNNFYPAQSCCSMRSFCPTIIFLGWRYRDNLLKIVFQWIIIFY